MKAIDTNMLVRIIVKDDVAQGKKALEYIKKNQPVFISHIVLCEFSCVFVDCYKFKKNELITALENILKTEHFAIENSDIIWGALHEYKHLNADFSDCVIGALAKSQGANKVGTFDKKASNSVFFELIH